MLIANRFPCLDSPKFLIRLRTKTHIVWILQRSDNLHLYVLQTTEAIGKDYPSEDWLHLTALIGIISNCGVENVMALCGSDDYMHLAGRKNGTTLPQAGLITILRIMVPALHRYG